MSVYIRRPNVKDVDAAVRLYYERFELSTEDIMTIFDVKSKATVAKLKNIVREEMAKSDQLPWNAHNVPTETAYKVWGLDITDLEKRRAKLLRLNTI